MNTFTGYSVLPLVVVLISAGCALAQRASEAYPATQFSGRWEMSNPVEPWCAWQGSSFKTSFQGRLIVAKLESDQNDYIRVILDGDHFRSRKIRLETGRHDYVLADHLDASKTHSIEVVKETYVDKGRLYFCGLSVEGGNLVAPEEKVRPLRLQFYGDSNLAGYSLESERNQDGFEFVGCHFTFAGIISRMLGAEYQNISVSGATILGQQNSILAFYDRIDFYKEEPKWDFDKETIDICVLNVGANDINQLSQQEIKANYSKLLRAIRRAHPDAHIVVMNGFGWDRKETANYTQDVVDEFGDPNVSRLAFPWLFNEWHGCEYDHAGMAQSLAKHLAELNPAWKPIAKMDVMDGFGRDGNIANGSFEFVAPFGGFGWRYRDSGATRIHAPNQSPDGEWYLQIPNGSEVHQPNPASSAHSYQYQLKLRSPDTGKATIQVEFRDQQFRNEIANTVRQFDLQLDANWQQYQLNVEAPRDSGDPSRNPWQVILRIKSMTGIIECDDVQLNSSPLNQLD